MSDAVCGLLGGSRAIAPDLIAIETAEKAVQFCTMTCCVANSRDSGSRLKGKLGLRHLARSSNAARQQFGAMNDHLIPFSGGVR